MASGIYPLVVLYYNGFLAIAHRGINIKRFWLNQQSLATRMPEVKTKHRDFFLVILSNWIAHISTERRVKQRIPCKPHFQIRLHGQRCLMFNWFTCRWSIWIAAKITHIGGVVHVLMWFYFNSITPCIKDIDINLVAITKKRESFYQLYRIRIL